MEINIIEIIPKLHRKRLCFETIFKKSGNVFHAKAIFFEFTQKSPISFLLLSLTTFFIKGIRVVSEETTSIHSLKHSMRDKNVYLAMRLAPYFPSIKALWFSLVFKNVWAASSPNPQLTAGISIKRLKKMPQLPRVLSPPLP